MAQLIVNQALRDAFDRSGAGRPLPRETEVLDMDCARVRDLLNALEEYQPGVRGTLETGYAVALDGEIHQDAWLEPLSADTEVCFVPAISGG